MYLFKKISNYLTSKQNKIRDLEHRNQDLEHRNQEILKDLDDVRTILNIKHTVSKLMEGKSIISKNIKMNSCENCEEARRQINMMLNNHDCSKFFFRKLVECSISNELQLYIVYDSKTKF